MKSVTMRSPVTDTTMLDSMFQARTRSLMDKLAAIMELTGSLVRLAKVILGTNISSYPGRTSDQVLF